MTIQEQIDQLKKEFDEKIMQIKNEVTLLTGFTGGNHQEVKTTRYYPNGAYMDEPEVGAPFFMIDIEVEDGIDEKYGWGGDEEDMKYLNSQNSFPSFEAAEKELNRQKLTAKMYRDMRDERINGDWVADWGNHGQLKLSPIIREGKICCARSWDEVEAGTIYFKNYSFIEDLKAMGWTEEELKIVWFGI